MNTRIKLRVMLSAALFIFLAAQTAKAGMIMQLVSVTPDNVYLGDYRWTYATTITTGDYLPGAFFTLYDLQGIVTVEAAWGPAGTHALGITPSGLNPVDDPAFPNLTVNHGNGGSTISNGQPFYSDVISTYGTVVDGVYSWQDLSNGSPTGVVQSGLGAIGVPSPQGTAPVPESSSLLLLGTGAAALAAFRRIRPRR